MVPILLLLTEALSPTRLSFILFFNLKFINLFTPN